MEMSGSPLKTKPTSIRRTSGRQTILQDAEGQVNTDPSVPTQTPKRKVSNPLMPAKTTTTLAKGTPGAGKLLSRGVTSPISTIDENVAPEADGRTGRSNARV
jgi:hypothetical protein